MGIPIRLVILVGALLTSAPIWAYYGVDYDHERPEKSLDSTIVPIHSRAYRMTQPDGRIRMLGRDPDHPNFLYGNGGWQGDIRGDEIEVSSEESLVDGTERTRFVFKGGLLVKLVLEGREYPFVRPKPPVRDLASLWPKDSGPTEEDLRKAAIWTGSDRLRLFYVNPNAAGAFLCMVALTILGLTLRQQWPVAVIGAILALGAVLLLVQTGSRSGLLAFALGLGIELFVILRKAFSWKLVAGLLLGVTILAGLASRSSQFEKLTGRLLAMDAGNSLRLERWQAVPKMFADAPFGWRGVPTGVTFGYWYQPDRNFEIRRTLVSAHAEWLVRFGWAFGLAYAFVWAFVLLVSFHVVRRTGRSTFLAVLSAFGFALVFNDIGSEWSLWVLPGALFLWELVRCRSGLFGRFLLRSSLISLGFGLLATFCLIFAGRMNRTPPLLRAHDRQVLINGTDPEIWVVEDFVVMGGWQMVGRDIRRFYADRPDAAPIGYVRKIEDLPADARKIVLAGRSCQSFLDKLAKSDAMECMSDVEKVVFLSPPFLASTVPQDLVKRFGIRVISGALAVRGTPDGANPPTWLRTVNGASLYIPDWLERVTRL